MSVFRFHSRLMWRPQRYRTDTPHGVDIPDTTVRWLLDESLQHFLAGTTGIDRDILVDILVVLLYSHLSQDTVAVRHSLSSNCKQRKETTKCKNNSHSTSQSRVQQIHNTNQSHTVVTVQEPRCITTYEQARSNHICHVRCTSILMSQYLALFAHVMYVKSLPVLLSNAITGFDL